MSSRFGLLQQFGDGKIMRMWLPLCWGWLIRTGSVDRALISKELL
jgi:hypothetical protein